MAQPIRITTTAEPAPERLSADELAYHAVVLRQVRAAAAVQESWTGHLVAKHGLGPGDQIEADGAIRRLTQQEHEEGSDDGNRG